MLRTKKLVGKIIEALEEHKGCQIVKIDLKKIDNCLCRFFVVCHGTSSTHVLTLADAVEEMARKELGEKPIHTEGEHAAQWVVSDYGDVIVHIFQKELRDYYQLEDFWADAEMEEIREPAYEFDDMCSDCTG